MMSRSERAFSRSCDTAWLMRCSAARPRLSTAVKTGLPAATVPIGKILSGRPAIIMFSYQLASLFNFNFPVVDYLYTELYLSTF